MRQSERTIGQLALLALTLALVLTASAYARPEARQEWRVVWVQAETAAGGEPAAALAAWSHAPGGELAIGRWALPPCARVRVSGEAWVSALAGSPHLMLAAGGPQASVYPQTVGAWAPFSIEAPVAGLEAGLTIGSSKEAGGRIEVWRLVVEVLE